MKSVDTPLNILMSFAYAGKDKSFADIVLSLAKDNAINLMIDSGAFSAFNNKGFDFVTLDNYCRFIDGVEGVVEKYVMLDVIGNATKSRQNYEEMLRRKLNPMFVVTMFDNDFSYIRNAVSHNPNICVAGGATVKNQWLMQRYQQVMKTCDNKARIHGLAFVTFPKMMQCRLASVDSSSWHVGASKFGDAKFFDSKGLHALNQRQMIKRLRGKDVNLQRALERLCVSKADIARPENFRGQTSVALYLSCRAQMEMQRYVYRRGLRLFLAASNKNAINTVMYLAEHWDNPTYDGFKAAITNRRSR